MLALGLPEPEITEVAGPAVRVSLLGGDPDDEVVGFLRALEPSSTARDLDAVLLIDHLARRGFVDVATAAPVLQRPPGETAAAIRRLAGATFQSQPVIVPINGVPAGHPAAYRLSDPARRRLAGRTAQLASEVGRARMIVDWARIRGRVSSTEVADLAGLSVLRSGQILRDLEQQGELAPGRAQRRGRGFFYVPA